MQNTGYHIFTYTFILILFFLSCEWIPANRKRRRDPTDIARMYQNQDCFEKNNKVNISEYIPCSIVTEANLIFMTPKEINTLIFTVK